VLAQAAAKHEITFPLLSDEGSATIRAFGIEAQDGLPHPGTILIDRNGQIRAKLFHDGYRQRHASDEIIEAAGPLTAS